jgi:uncharacterized protein
MMLRRPVPWWLPWLAALLCACSSSPPPRYYVLDPIAETAAPTAGPSIVVEAVTIPAEVDRPQFVLRGEANEVVIDDMHRWAAPLQSSLAGVLASNLAAILGTPDVATESIGNISPRYRVSVEILGFQSRLGEEVRLEAAWHVRRTGGAESSGRSSFREAAQGRDFSALAAAHSRAVSSLSAQIAHAIRALEQQS